MCRRSSVLGKIGDLLGRPESRHWGCRPASGASILISGRLVFPRQPTGHVSAQAPRACVVQMSGPRIMARFILMLHGEKLFSFTSPFLRGCRRRCSLPLNSVRLDRTSERRFCREDRRTFDQRVNNHADVSDNLRLLAPGEATNARCMYDRILVILSHQMAGDSTTPALHCFVRRRLRVLPNVQTVQNISCCSKQNATPARKCR